MFPTRRPRFAAKGWAQTRQNRDTYHVMMDAGGDLSCKWKHGRGRQQHEATAETQIQKLKCDRSPKKFQKTRIRKVKSIPAHVGQTTNKQTIGLGSSTSSQMLGRADLEVRYCAVLCGTVLYCTVLYCTVLFCSVWSTEYCVHTYRSRQYIRGACGKRGGSRQEWSSLLLCYYSWCRRDCRSHSTEYSVQCTVYSVHGPGSGRRKIYWWRSGRSGRQVGTRRAETVRSNGYAGGRRLDVCRAQQSGQGTFHSCDHDIIWRRLRAFGDFQYLGCILVASADDGYEDECGG